MGAVLYRIRVTSWRHASQALVATLVVALVGAIVIAIAAGAHRTATAPDRLSAHSSLAFDALITQDEGGRPRTAEVAALPSVESAASITFVFGGLTRADGSDIADAIVFTGDPGATGARVVNGRDASPNDAHEMVVSQSFADRFEASIGDTFDLFTLSQDQAAATGLTDDADPGGPLQVSVVGIIDGPGRLDDDTPLVVVSPALLDDPDIGVSQTLTNVDLQAGSSMDDLRADLDSLDGGTDLRLERGEVVSDAVRRAVATLARGLWLLLTVTALAAVAVLGQMISRQVRASRAERERLTAIGFTNSQILAESLGRAAIPITLGSLLAAGLAIIPSGLFPYGFARVVEPAPGLRADWGILLGAAALLLSALILCTWASLALTRSSTARAHPSPIVEACATRMPNASGAIGMRLAFVPRARQRSSVRSELAGVTLTVAGIVAAVAFGTSVDRLLNEPARYGVNYDAAIGDNGADALPDGLADELEADPDVTSMMIYTDSHARAGVTTVPMLGWNVVRGDSTPAVLAGRLPAGADEVAFGRATARQIDAHVGDQIRLDGPTDAATFRVTGLVVVPGLAANDGVGNGGVVTVAGLDRIDDEAQPTMVALDFRTSPAAFVAAHPELGNPPGEESVPAVIVNVQRVRIVPYALAGVLALLGLLTLAHVMSTSTRDGLRDLSILSALGAERRWIRSAIRWQAASFTLLCIVVGVPIGLVVGRSVFRLFADNMGTIDDPALPLALLAVGSLTAVVIATGVATLTAVRARRVPAAVRLRAE